MIEITSTKLKQSRNKQKAILNDLIYTNNKYRCVWLIHV